MAKIFKFLSENILFIITLFLLAFIPLYPKLPLINVNHTWVYVRLEDFFVLFALCIWFIYLIRGKVSLKTPLTFPILLFWVVGGLATFHAVLIIFPTLANVFPNVAFLSYLRRIEYISLFFVAYASIRNKKDLPYAIWVLVGTLLLVFAYGFGQKFFGFNAYLTMNEEYAKGLAIQLSRASRIPSTFAGHYDLAAYLVFILPIIVALIIGFRNAIVRVILAVSVLLGFVLLYWTVSRVSFVVLFISLVFLTFLYSKKLILYSIPIVAIIIAIFSIAFSNKLLSSTGLLSRFGSTVKEINVLVDAKTGAEIGHVKEVPGEIVTQRIVLARNFRLGEALNIFDKETIEATSASVVVFKTIPQKIIEVVPPDVPTGENLPQGTGYINLSLSPVTRKLSDFYYENKNSSDSHGSNIITLFHGSFLVKRAAAYDLSFTTRFQGEWPNAMLAFQRNILFGSGYSSIGLAVDNNLLRILGEVGILGFATFFGIFVMIAAYIKKVLSNVDSPVTKSFVLGYTAGLVGLILNATLIDVFEASKVAYTLWLLTGVVLGILKLYQSKSINLYQEFKNFVTSDYAYVAYFAILALVLFSPMLNNYFTGDDFTWFKWAADCSTSFPGATHCPSFLTRILHYFVSSDGFFYRPGTKIYFLSLYNLFWFNQSIYHTVSLVLHIINIALVFLLARKILKDKLLSALAGFIYLILSGFGENIFWIAATGHLFSEMFVLISLLLFISWDNKKKILYYIASFISLALSLLFYEIGVVVPLLIFAYKITLDENFKIKRAVKDITYQLLCAPIILYLFVRFFAQSHWFNGDYSYNLIKLPFNAIGNGIGYFLLGILGSNSLSAYETLRILAREHILIAIMFIFIAIGFFYLLFRYQKKLITGEFLSKDEKRVVLFGFSFFVITLLPFLGLGNITSRYSYLSSAGIVLIFVIGLKKLYEYLLINGKPIALSAITVFICVFSLFHIIQIRELESDWFDAGEHVRKFFVAVDASFEDYWAFDPMKLYFTDVPVKLRNAWVFPLGTLNDSLWFIFRNQNIQVYQVGSLDQALNQVGLSRDEKVFKFEEDGSVSEYRKEQTPTGVIIQKKE